MNNNKAMHKLINEINGGKIAQPDLLLIDWQFITGDFHPDNIFYLTTHLNTIQRRIDVLQVLVKAARVYDSHPDNFKWCGNTEPYVQTLLDYYTL